MSRAPWLPVVRSGENFAVADVSPARRNAARLALAGSVLPDIVRGADGRYRAVWRPIGVSVDAASVAETDRLMRCAGRGALETGEGRAETVHDAWLAALRSDDGTLDSAWTADAAALGDDLRVWRTTLDAPRSVRASLRFELHAPPGPDGAWRIVVPACARGRTVLRALGQAFSVFPPLAALRAEASGSLATAVSCETAETFLRSGAPALTAAGYSVSVPEGLAGEHVALAAELESRSEKSVGRVTARVTVHVDGEAVSADEIRFLLDQGTPFVFFRNRWIEVDRRKLAAALRVLEAENGRRLSGRAALAAALGFGRIGTLRVTDVRTGGRLSRYLGSLEGEGLEPLPPPAGFAGTLRDYQIRGFSWLARLTDAGFGPCLADDMGLGKTAQTIAWILRHRASRAGCDPVLVVAPVSVTYNWVRELKRFAPDLKVYLHQGEGRAAGTDVRRRARKADVTVTGYALLVRDFRALDEAGFGALVLDEAQTVKNPDTRAARAVRALDIPVRLALTGTPVENGPGDLWSLEEFLNPGLLGPRADFLKTFAPALTPTTLAARSAKLRRTLAPFLLRRLKTDPGVAPELGPKHEIRDYCGLTQAQRTAYEEALARYQRERTEMAPSARRGRALALLTELKQICDGDGKTERLDDLLEKIFENGESALVFTQYARVGARLREHLEAHFGRRIPFLHGGLSPKEREAEIASFNDAAEPTAFVLSLKAGGFGLNLVRATHVVHYDRWWNPAVENQATDRAHRIGQTGTVFVHTFICAGTVEDHVDRLLEEKRRVAGEIVGSGEAFLAGLDDDAFARVTALDMV